MENKKKKPDLKKMEDKVREGKELTKEDWVELSEIHALVKRQVKFLQDKNYPFY